MINEPPGGQSIVFGHLMKEKNATGFPVTFGAGKEGDSALVSIYFLAYISSSSAPKSP